MSWIVENVVDRGKCRGSWKMSWIVENGVDSTLKIVDIVDPRKIVDFCQNGSRFASELSEANIISRNPEIFQNPRFPE